MISACGRDKLFLDLKDADHRQMVADATFIGRTEIGAFGLLTTIGGVLFEQEG